MSLDSATNEAVREVARTLLTEEAEAVAARTGAVPGYVAATRERAALYVRLTEDTSLVPAVIAALRLPVPELPRGRHDSVFVNLQQELVAMTAADTAPRLSEGSPPNRARAAAFWEEWWRTSGGLVPFPDIATQRTVLARWATLALQHSPSDWPDLLTRSTAGDEELERVIRSVAVRVVTLPFDSLVRLAVEERDSVSAAREWRRRAIHRLRGDFLPQATSALVRSLERGPTTQSRAEAVAEAEVFYLTQEALVRHTGVVDAPYFPTPSSAARDSAVEFWRARWSADSTGWQRPADRYGAAAAARWAVDRVVPELREDRAFWRTMLTALPLASREVREAVRSVVLELLLLRTDSIEQALSDLGAPLSAELAFSLANDAVMFARAWPHEGFVPPLIDRLGRAEGTGAFANQRFEALQTALIATTGLHTAPRLHDARPSVLRDAQRFWSRWWSENAEGFTPVDSARAVDAVHAWLNRRGGR